MRKQVLATMGLLAFGGVALAAGPQGPRPPHGPRGVRGSEMVERLRDEVGLSEPQVDQIKRIHMDARKSAIRQRADVAIARLELRELLGADTVDAGAVSAKVQKLADLQAATLKMRVDTQLAARKVMTPEQFQKAKRLRQGGGPRPMGPGHERGPRRGALEMDDEDGPFEDDVEEAEGF